MCVKTNHNEGQTGNKNLHCGTPTFIGQNLRRGFVCTTSALVLRRDRQATWVFSFELHGEATNVQLYEDSGARTGNSQLAQLMSKKL